MDFSKFESSWNNLGKFFEREDETQSHQTYFADLNHLQQLGAHKALIDVAKKRPNIGPLSIAPNQKQREHSPEWMFKNSVPIGKDDLGNFVLWMDVTRLDSQILFVCHDPSEVTVLANTPVNFLDDFKNYISNSTGKIKQYILSSYLEDWVYEPKFPTGIIHQKHSDTEVFDFNTANIGDSITLDALGKNTIVIESTPPGRLTLGTESEEVITKLKRRDRNWAIGTAALLIVMFSLFYFGLNKSIWASLALSAVSLVVIFWIFMMMLDAYWSWLEKQTNN